MAAIHRQSAVREGIDKDVVVVRCPMCFSRRDEVIADLALPASPWRVVRCLDCGLRFTNPRPAEAAWANHYPPDYIPHRSRRASALRVHWHDKVRCRMAQQYPGSIWKSLLDRLLHAIGDPSLIAPFGGRRLLDFGCGGGDYLARMRSLGWNVMGLERSPQAVASAIANHRIEVIAGGLPSPALQAGSFDLITAWEVFEHLERPRQSLAACRELLHPDGCLAISVPNQAGWAARHFGPDWYGLDLPRHLVHFTADTLAKMLDAEDFDIVAIATISHPSWIRKSAVAARKYNGGSRSPLENRTFAGAISRLARRYGRAESLFAIARPRRPLSIAGLF